jgi:hypothetical protein
LAVADREDDVLFRLSEKLKGIKPHHPDRTPEFKAWSPKSRFFFWNSAMTPHKARLAFGHGAVKPTFSALPEMATGSWYWRIDLLQSVNATGFLGGHDLEGVDPPKAATGL